MYKINDCMHKKQKKRWLMHIIEMTGLARNQEWHEVSENHLSKKKDSGKNSGRDKVL